MAHRTPSRAVFYVEGARARETHSAMSSAKRVCASADVVGFPLADEDNDDEDRELYDEDARARSQAQARATRAEESRKVIRLFQADEKQRILEEGKRYKWFCKAVALLTGLFDTADCIRGWWADFRDDGSDVNFAVEEKFGTLFFLLPPWAQLPVDMPPPRDSLVRVKSASIHSVNLTEITIEFKFDEEEEDDEDSDVEATSDKCCAILEYVETSNDLRCTSVTTGRYRTRSPDTRSLAPAVCYFVLTREEYRKRVFDVLYDTIPECPREIARLITRLCFDPE